MLIYSVTDIHGSFEELQKALNVIEEDAKGAAHKIYFLGDYIDRGPQSLEVLQTVKGMVEDDPEKYEALLGNHEQMFLDFLDKGDKLYLANNPNLEFVNELLSKSMKCMVWGNYEVVELARLMFQDNAEDVSKEIRREIIETHGELVRWIRNLALYQEEEDIIYIHAGIDRTLADWKETPKHEMIWMMPQEGLEEVEGKVVVCGHVITRHIDYPVGPCFREKAKVVYQDVGVSYRDCELCVMCYDNTRHTLRLVTPQMDFWKDTGEVVEKVPKREITI